MKLTICDVCRNHTEENMLRVEVKIDGETFYLRVCEDCHIRKRHMDVETLVRLSKER